MIKAFVPPCVAKGILLKIKMKVRYHILLLEVKMITGFALLLEFLAA
jgi:hypothetical protein